MFFIGSTNKKKSNGGRGLLHLGFHNTVMNDDSPADHEEKNVIEYT